MNTANSENLRRGRPGWTEQAGWWTTLASCLLCAGIGTVITLPGLAQTGGLTNKDARHAKVNLQYPLNVLAEKLGRSAASPAFKPYRREYSLAAPGKTTTVILIDRMASDKATIAFPDGNLVSKNARDTSVQSTKGTPNDLDTAMMVSLVVDDPQDFLTLLQEGAEFRLEGTGYRPQEFVVAEDYSGPLYDLVAVTARDEAGVPTSVRRYLIDARTGLVGSVVTYRASDTSRIATTQYSDWIQRGDSWIPQRIRRLDATESSILELVLRAQ